MRRLLLLPYTFVLMNWAAIRALLCFLRGDGLEALWADPPRRTGAGRALGHSKP